MRAYVLTIVVIDHDRIGSAGVKAAIEEARYPNRCIGPSVESATEYDIGAWTDDHPLNLRSTDKAQWLREHGSPKPG